MPGRRIKCFAFVALLAMIATLALAVDTVGAGPSRLSSDTVTYLAPVSDEIIDEHCPVDHEHPDCGLVSGACANHFAGVWVQAFDYSADRVTFGPTGDDVRRLALVFDLLRPPRISL